MKNMKIIHVNNDKALEDFNDSIQDAHALVLFYMDGCPHCEIMKPEWNKFEKNLERNGMKHSMKSPKSLEKMIARVNSDYINRVNCDRDILGYPTIFEMVGGNKKKEYNGNRTAEDFEVYFNSMNMSVGGGKNKSKTNKKSKKNKNKNKNKTNKKNLSKKNKKRVKKNLRKKSNSKKIKKNNNKVNRKTKRLRKRF